MSEENQNEQQIMVPLDDLDKVEESDAHTLDALAMELATIQQSAKKVAIILKEAGLSGITIVTSRI